MVEPGRGVALGRAARVAVFATSVPLLVRLPLDRLQRLLEPRRGLVPEIDVRSEGRDVLAHLARARRRGRPLVRDGCLVRGITLYRFLRQAGADVALCFGVGHVDGRAAAHCWIEHDDVPVLEPETLVDPRETFAEVARISRLGTTGRSPLPR